MNNLIKGVIFDFNGVLLWDTKLHDDSWRKFSMKLRSYPLTDNEMTERVHGQPNKNIQEYILGRPVSESEFTAYVNEKESLYRTACLALGTEFKLSPGSIELLEYLQEKKMPFTIATSSEIGNVQFFFKNLHLDRWFDIHTVVFDDGTYPGKPAPDIYLKAAEKIGIPPDECLVIEDARSGIRAAHAAGIGYIAALGPKENHSELSKLPGVRVTIERLDDLLSSKDLLT